MDTTQGQNMGQPMPVQPNQPVQPATQNQQTQDSGKIPAEQIFQAPQPSQSQVTQPPVQNIPTAEPLTPKITLDDLYGPSSPTTQPVPDLPLTQPMPQVSIPQENTVPIVQQETPQTTGEIPTGVPLRKQQMVSSPTIPIPQNPSDENSNEKPDEKPKKKPNTLFFLRIIFGAIGVVVGVVILMFVVTFLSSVFHPSTSGKVTLTFWGLWEDSTVMQTAISQFENQHPGITVVYEKEDPKEYSQRLLTRIQEGNGPDIFTYHSSWLPMVQQVLVPLPTNVISKTDLQNNFYSVVGHDLVKNGALYGVPLEVDTLSLFVNTALFQSAKAQVPTTWDSFSSTARALTQKDGSGKIKIAGAALGTYDNITHAPDILSALFVQNGVDIPTLSPKSNASDALSFYTTFATGDSKVWDDTLDPSQLAFAKGNLAMYFGYSWDIFAIKALNPNVSFSVNPIPHLPGRNTTTASYWVNGVSAKSIHQKEAFLFMQFLAQKNTAALLYSEEAKTRLFGEPYARSDLGATLKDNPLVYPFVSQATDATSSFFAGETDDTGLNGQMNGYLGNAVRSVLNNTSTDSAIDTLLQGVQQIENQYGSH